MASYTADPDVVEARLHGTFLWDFVVNMRGDIQTLYDQVVIPYVMEKNAE